MIPERLDDGFTREPVEGVFCRPMLWVQRQEWKAVACSKGTVEAWEYLRQYVTAADEALVAENRVAVIQAVCGYTAAAEERDFQDLHDSVWLHQINPGLSLLSCETCRAYSVDHEKGEVYIAASGQPVPLPPGTKVPCESRYGCAKLHWSEPIGLSEDRWLKTWRHYWAFRNVPEMYTDHVFRRNAALIGWIVDYGRDRRFDPFTGRSSGRGAAYVPSERAAGPCGDRAGGSDRGETSGAGGTGSVPEDSRTVQPTAGSTSHAGEHCPDTGSAGTAAG